MFECSRKGLDLSYCKKSLNPQIKKDELERDTLSAGSKHDSSARFASIFRCSSANCSKQFFLWQRHLRCTKSASSIFLALGPLTPDLPLATQVASSSEAKSIVLNPKLRPQILAMAPLDSWVIKRMQLDSLSLGNPSHHSPKLWSSVSSKLASSKLQVACGLPVSSLRCGMALTSLLPFFLFVDMIYNMINYPHI